MVGFIVRRRISGVMIRLTGNILVLFRFTHKLNGIIKHIKPKELHNKEIIFSRLSLWCNSLVVDEYILNSLCRVNRVFLI